jgi:hypothetical protein
MRCLQIHFEFTEELVLKKVVFLHNETGIEESPVLMRQLAICLLKRISLNKEDIELQDILFKAGIKIE